ncbi:unnamed protein product [Cochlearia groenlandica]
MGGTKRAIKIAKIEKKTVKSVTFTKRRDGLFRKAKELCLLSPTTQIAILATPPSTNSHASFYSFGHSSVDNVVSSLLHDDKSPTIQTTITTENQENVDENQGLGFWWEDRAFDRSENEEDLRKATDAVTRMLNNVRIRLDEKRRVESDQHRHHVLDECLVTDHVKEEEEEEMLEIPEIVWNDIINEEEVPKFEDLFDDDFTHVTIDPLF